MGELLNFTFESHEVRTVLRDGEPWFVASDVCRILEIDTSVAVNGRNRADGSRTDGLDEDEKGTDIVSTGSGQQIEVLVVSEPAYIRL